MALTKAQGKFSQAIDDGANATAITIDSSERVGIGTGSDAINGDSQLHVKTGNISGMMVETTADSYAHLQIKSSEGWWGLGLRPEHNGALSLRNNATGGVPLYIDETGNVLVAKTALDNSTVGCRFNATGDASFVANANRALVVVRKSSDGEMALFLKDSTTVGKITTRSGQFAIGCNGTGLEFNDSNDAIIPFSPNANNTRDNQLALGMPSIRFDDAYVTQGVTAGSDERDKQDISALDEAETRVAVACKGLLRKWRWKDAVEAKDNNPDSDEVARIHFGIIAQELKAAFEAEGLDAGRYGMFIHSTWIDEETGEERDRMGIRYSELLAFIIAAI